MASKIDKVIDRLERLTNDVNEIKAKAIPLLPVPPLVKGAARAIVPTFDQVVTDTYFDGVRAIADVVLPADSAREIINNPNVLMDSNGTISQITPRPAATKPRKVTKKMKQQRKIQSTAFKNANAKGRLQNGTFRAGFDQSRIARMAQKECTKERIRLGLCDDPKKKMKKKSSAKRK
ncbi:MAG: hypothetical protein [Circular genetic element sp.]|nr:MAG: hypothetical protein [Circular genetic element sp.]